MLRRAPWPRNSRDSYVAILPLLASKGSNALQPWPWLPLRCVAGFGETDVTIINNSLWGLAALSRASDLDFDRTTPMERPRVNALSAMICRGVRAKDAVPRSAEENRGRLYRSEKHGDANRYSAQNARRLFIRFG